jgi:transcriptional regulator with XRE-family HTH domain
VSTLSTIIGSNIRDHRKLAGITQAELAWRVGTHRPIVSRVERGTHEIGLDSIYRYADALDIPVGFLLQGVDAAVRKLPRVASQVRTR